MEEEEEEEEEESCHVMVHHNGIEELKVDIASSSVCSDRSFPVLNAVTIESPNECFYCNYCLKRIGPEAWELEIEENFVTRMTSDPPSGRIVCRLESR